MPRMQGLSSQASVRMLVPPRIFWGALYQRVYFSAVFNRHATIQAQDMANRKPCGFIGWESSQHSCGRQMTN